MDWVEEKKNQRTNGRRSEERNRSKGASFAFCCFAETLTGFLFIPPLRKGVVLGCGGFRPFKNASMGCCVSFLLSCLLSLSYLLAFLISFAFLCGARGRLGGMTGSAARLCWALFGSCCRSFVVVCFRGGVCVGVLCLFALLCVVLCALCVSLPPRPLPPCLVRPPPFVLAMYLIQ